ncbi:Acetyltransferase (GNAT) family protein [Friedmanniella luteola]|uniref:Acetyltransferase (GNAT) family protein n=1 Tax=Friedmanniella luteola TaxID=546871 RepID=A0A1H1RWL1_9ACTN|nr:GNAT family N-acetyltransferase [Friedmanniella luteola]SDS40043.1 Acetyltransferase (GNAT) family protein [Friedmanniella luteola]
MPAELETRPVGPPELGVLERLFASERTTRHCWCTAFCTSRARFAAGWFGGGNRRRFEALAGGELPMGVLASRDGEPVGWGAAGPRSRYLGADPARHPLLRDRSRAEDGMVWLLPCLVVHADHRRRGVNHALVEAAIALARSHGAVAVEGWPLAAGEDRPADAFVGREQLFAELGFQQVDRPAPGRVLVRLDLPTT